MEILELLFGLTQMCGCFLEMGALVANASATSAGYKLYKERKAAGKDDALPTVQTPVWPFLLLVFFAVFITSLVAWKYSR